MAKLSVDSKLVRKLAALLRETGLTEIEYGSGSERIRVSRAAAAAPEMSNSPAAEPAVAAAPEAAAEAAPPGTLFAPMVGTVYVAADPDSASGGRKDFRCGYFRS